MRALETVQSNLGGQIDSLGMEVGQARQDIKNTGSELQALRKEFLDYVEQATRTANVQRSETKVGSVKAQLDREFGHYSVVRRSSVGMLQAFDVGNVSNNAVQAISEELMIQSPRYWLAPGLVALAAWSRDDEGMAKKSIEEAFRRDRSKTSLFFALVLRRQGRNPAAVRWLRHYLASLDPHALTREFAVILEASSYGAFGPAGQALVAEKMATWVRELRNNQEIVESQVKNWIKEIGTRRDVVVQDGYEVLAQLAPGWSEMVQQMESASALPNLIEVYQAVRDHDSSIPSTLEEQLDQILDALVTDYDEEELPLRREVVYHEAVIEENGDLGRAQERADLLTKALEQTSDVVSLQTMAAINPEALGVSIQTQRVAIGVGQSDFRSAVHRFVANYRAHSVNHLDLNFDQNHSNYAQTYKFTGVTLNTATAEASGIEQLEQTWRTTMESYIDAASFKNKWYIKPGLIAGAICLVLLIISVVVGIVALVVGGGAVWFLGEQEKKKCGKKVADAEQARDNALALSVQMYRDALAQRTDAFLIYEELDDHEAEVLRMIDTWPTAVSSSEEVA